jgi:hypothetical protein
MKIHSKSVNLNAKILRKIHILSVWHDRLDLRKHPFVDPPGNFRTLFDSKC